MNLLSDIFIVRCILFHFELFQIYYELRARFSFEINNDILVLRWKKVSPIVRVLFIYTIFIVMSFSFCDEKINLLSSTSKYKNASNSNRKPL